MENKPEIYTEPSPSDSNGLTRKQKESLPYFIGCKSVTDACRKAKVSKSTFFRWVKAKSFRDSLESARGKLIEEAMERLEFAVTEAAENLIELARDDSKWVRLRACERLLELFFRQKEAIEIEGKLAEIERVIEKRVYR